MALNIYDVDKKYIQFLQEQEREKRGFTRVPNMNYENREQKFVCGVVFRQNGMNYYVPVSSNKTDRKSTILIEFNKDKFNKIKGSLNFAYMFPVPTCAIKRKNIFDELDQAKRNFLFGELAFIQSHKSEILTKAKNVYFQIANNRDEKFKYICCDFKFLETKAKLWEKEQMKDKDREVYYVKDTLDISNILNYEQSVERLQMGIPLVMEAFVDKEGKFYTRYDLEDMFRDVSLDEEFEIMSKMGMKDCYIEVEDLADYKSLRYKYYSNCIINPSAMDLSTSSKLNTTIKVLTDPSFCFNKEKCSQIKKELIEAKPLTIEKLANISEKYIDDKAKNILKVYCEKSTEEPNTYEKLISEIDWSSNKLFEENLKTRRKEIIWGSELEGADVYTKDLEVAQSIARDIDGADIPNDTPMERQGVKQEVQKARKQKEKMVEKELSKEKKVFKVDKKGIEK